MAAGQYSVYAAFVDGRIFRMDRNTFNFVPGTWTELPHPWGNRRVTGIVAQAGSGVVWVTVGAFNDSTGSGQVFESPNYGQTWLNLTGNLPNVPADAIILNGSTTYVGNDDGVYAGVSGAGNFVWTRFSTGLPHVQVTNLQIQNYAGTTVLAAATHGRGAWLITITIQLVPGGGNDMVATSQGSGGSQITLDSQSTVNQGADWSGSGSFADPNSGPYTSTVNYGDGSGSQALTLNPDGSFTLSHTYATPGIFAVAVQVTDAEWNTDSALQTVTVLNPTPAVMLDPASALNDGDTLTTSGAFADPVGSSWTATVDYGDGSGPQPLTLNADNTFDLSHAYAGVGTYTSAIPGLDVKDYLQ